MNIVSWEFLLFACGVVLLYFALPKKCQWIVVLLSNLVFYAYAGVHYLGYMLVISFAAYIGAIRLEKVTAEGKRLVSQADTQEKKKEIKENTISRKKLIATIAIILSMGIWGILKYTNFS